MQRRDFLRQTLAGGAALAGVRPGAAAAESGPEFSLTLISGKPRERGRQYGRKFSAPIRAFLDRELYSAFTGKPSTRDDMLRYAGDCAREIARYSPPISEEMEGMAEGSGLRLEELVLITLHEELYHRGVLQSTPHCTVAAAGPPDTSDGCTYVGQTWDWMQSVYGLANLLMWKRPEGPDVMAYAYPGLWTGAGLNSAGIALCWTSCFPKDGIAGPRVGIPSYVLIAQILYQETLKDAIAEARRARHAGWFTFGLADGEGRLANIEGSPRELAVELTRGHIARHDYGSRQMTRTSEGQDVPYNERTRYTFDLLRRQKGRIDRASLQGILADQVIGRGALDLMLFNTTRREAYLSRGPGSAARWKTFTFESADG